MSPLIAGSPASTTGSVAARAVLTDVLALCKPGIVTMCLISTAAGLCLAPGTVAPARLLLALLGTALAVGGGNALNMYLERDSDRLMERTRKRPLPDRRLRAEVAFTFGLICSALGLLVLSAFVTLMAALLAAIALSTYVLVYTPLKRRSPLALLVGAVPGAMPPLIGWVSITGAIALPGLVLFAVLLLWQIAHFLAIGLFRKAEYAQAGMRILPLTHGDAVARVGAIVSTILLMLVATSLVPLGAAGGVYLMVAGAVSLWLLAEALRHLRARRGRAGGRQFFLYTLIYLPVWVAGLALDVVLR